LCVDFAAKSGRIDEIDEGAPAVDLDHREPLAVQSFELGVPGDVDLLERLATLQENSPRPLAEVASLRVVEDDVRDRFRA
jgi:hypothetical protein